MPRYRRWKHPKPLHWGATRCPECGRPRRYPDRIGISRRHGRPKAEPAHDWVAAADRAGRPPRPSVRIRIHDHRDSFNWRLMSRPCQHPFHLMEHRGERPAKPDPGAAPRGRRGHHPDLRKAKAQLSRRLQGKDRR